MIANDIATLFRAFVKTRWGLNFKSRAHLEAYQERHLKVFLAKKLPAFPFYKKIKVDNLQQLPIMTKELVLKNFSELNSKNISLESATRFGLDIESNREFQLLLNGITIGLSSGTQGPRGVFLISKKERLVWSGVMLAKALPPTLLKRMLLKAKPIKIAFFLRANSRLYSTLTAAKRIEFEFYDLLDQWEELLWKLEVQNPDVIVAPAKVLSLLASKVEQGTLSIKPNRLISVAEVLEPDDQALIEKVFQQKVHQIYQATEGFLGITCEHNIVHLNEEFIHVEPKWIDNDKTRFLPIVTDFTRTTQAVVRYQLTDILKIRSEPCPCGSHCMAIEEISGRNDDILWMQKPSGDWKPIFPDIIRQGFYASSVPFAFYKVRQKKHIWEIVAGQNSEHQQVEAVRICQSIANKQDCILPAINFIPPEDDPIFQKSRRIQCIERPEKQ